MDKIPFLLRVAGVGVVGLDVEAKDLPHGRVLVVGPVEEEIIGADAGGVQLHG